MKFKSRSEMIRDPEALRRTLRAYYPGCKSVLEALDLKKKDNSINSELKSSSQESKRDSNTKTSQDDPKPEESLGLLVTRAIDALSKIYDDTLIYPQEEVSRISKIPWNSKDNIVLWFKEWRQLIETVKKR